MHLSCMLSRHHQYNRIGQLDNIEQLRLHPPAQPWQPPQRQAHRSQRYGYNAQQRLTSEAVHSHQDDGRTIGQGEQHWHYDNAGNRIHPDDTRYRPLERAAPGNRLHRSAHARYRHDAWGNVVQIDHTAGQLKGQQVRLAYDGEHRLLVSERIQTGTDGQRHSVLTRYHYDPMSRRVGKQHLQRVSQGDGQKTEWRIQSSLWFGWDGDRMVTMQNDRQASTTIYEPGSFVPMLRVDKQLQADERRAKGETRTYHIHCNYLGTPEALIDQNDLQLVWQIELDPWGQTQREYNPNNMLQPIRMQGQQLDSETGLFYNRYRYYDPSGGRYVTQDPIGLAGGVNFYGYVGGEPLSLIDPFGLTGNAHQRAIARGVNEFKKPHAMVENAPKKDLKELINDVVDEVKKIFDGETTKRTDEAIVCTRQENTKTEEKSIPPDVMTPNSRGVGVTRPPSPSEIDSPFKCIQTRIRPMVDAGPLPGLDAGSYPELHLPRR
jgi:RHS repeat-associated protein